MRRFCICVFVLAAALASSAAVEAGSVRFVRGSAPAGGDGLSWASAHNQLFDALDAASGDASISQIWVAEGSYSPRRSGANRDQTFSLVSGVALFGGFAGNETMVEQRDPALHVTTLSGDFNGNDGPSFAGRTDNARHIVQGTDVSGVRVDGFVLRGGFADFPGDDLLGGGAMHLHRCAATIANCVFLDNVAGGVAPDLGGFGGALYIQGGDVDVLNCRFEANRGMNGGALGVSGFEQDRTSIDAIVDIESCEFVNNFSPSQTGGAIWSATGDPLEPQLGIVGEIRVRGCRFADNRAEYYGAWIDQNTPVLRIEDTLFAGNTSVLTGALGIGQTVGIASMALVRACRFEGNTIEDDQDFGGSAIFIQARPVLIDACIARDNQGSSTIRSGPVIGFSGGAKELDVRNSLLAGNSGTAVFGFRNPSVSVRSCTIANNESGITGGLAGGIETSAASLVVENSVLWGNRRGGIADEAAQVRSFSVSPMLNFCVVQGLTGSLGGTGNLGDDPLFADGNGGDFHLSAGSPAIDAGSNLLAPDDPFDLDGDGDLAEAVPFDLDAQARFQDDPATANTGVAGAGHTQIIDIGAFEFAAACLGDVDGDGQVGLGDLATLLSNFGTLEGASPDDGDLDSDGDVDLMDLASLLARFGASC